MRDKEELEDMIEKKTLDKVELSGRVYESVDELKRRLGISDSGVAKAIKRGALPHPIRIGRRRFFDRAETDMLLTMRHP